jgi:hypothetical protein
MHLDPTLVFVVPDGMLEARQVEISPEFAIDPRQNIHIKRGGNASRVVIRKLQLRSGFLKIGGEQQGIAFLKNGPHFAEKLIARWTIEIPNRASEKKHEHSLAVAPTGSHFLEAV